MGHFTAFVYAYGYLGIFPLLMLGIIGLPVPDECLLTFVGYLISRGYFHAVPTLGTAVLGSVCGISVSYGLGHTLGISIVHRYGQWLHITEERMDRVHAWFDRAGRWSLMFGYFIPGVRHLTGFVAGTSKLRFPEFALFAYAGAIVWSVSFIAIGYYSGKEWARTVRAIHQDIMIGAVLMAIIILAYLFFVKKPRCKE